MRAGTEDKPRPRAGKRGARNETGVAGRRARQRQRHRRRRRQRLVPGGIPRCAPLYLFPGCLVGLRSDIDALARTTSTGLMSTTLNTTSLLGPRFQYQRPVLVEAVETAAQRTCQHAGPV